MRSSLAVPAVMLGALWLGAAAAAQEPLGVSRTDLEPQSAIPLFQTPPVDVEAQLARATAKRDPAEPAPMEFAQVFEVHLTPETSGAWELVDLGRRGRVWLWRLAIESPNALSVNLGFTTYR